MEIDQGNEICIRRIETVYMHMYILKTTCTQTNCHLNLKKIAWHYLSLGTEVNF